MKKKLLYLLLFFTTWIADAQIVNIPDTNFKNKLLSATTSNNIAKDSDGNSIVIDTNGDLEIQESEALLIWQLNLGAAGMSDATGLEAFTNLRVLICSVNPLLTNLDLTNLMNLETFICDGGTGLEFLSFAGLSNLQTVFIKETNLYTIDLTGLSAIENFTLDDVPVTNLDFSDMVSLSKIGLYNTNLVNIDLNNSSLLGKLRCIGNSLVETINIKNGSTLVIGEDSLFNDNPNLNFICIDEYEEYIIDMYFDVAPSYSSYCSFTPGGDYNTITGTVIFDSENDGCENNVPHHFLKIHITDGVNEGYSFTNNNGEYMFYVGAGNYTITPEFENDWFVSSPLGQDINFPAVDGSVYTQDFCITGNGEVHEDIEVIMVPVGAARPGFPADYKIVYRNKGNQVLSGNVSCTWDYSILNEADVIPVPDIVVPGSYTWNFTNLLPFEDREIVMTLNVNAPTDEPPVNANDVLDFVATAALAGTDEIPEDNTYELNQVVVNSYDPNIITCIEGGTESSEAIGEYLHYVVDFENTGSAAASFVVVKHDINPAQFDISSLQVLNSSHQVEARINGNRLEFIFQDINLAAADHGNILFRLKSLETLQAGDTVMNTANIYFDYNYPIETNEATTLFEELVNGLDEFDIDRSVTIYPNPAENILNIEAKGAIKTIELYDIQARLLQTAEVNGTGVRFDISARAPGVYFLKITTFEGVKVEKVIKK